MEKYLEIEKYVKQGLESNDNGHGFEHISRVLKNVKIIINDEIETYKKDIDVDLCIISAYVHDLIDKKVVDDVEESKKRLKEFLLKCNYSSEFVDEVLYIAENISFSKGVEVTTDEAKIVQDADRLDAIGAMGIARAIIYGNSVGHPIYIPNHKENTSVIGHFHKKMYKIPHLLNTNKAKEIAKDRVKIMTMFEEQVIKELGTE